MDRRPLIALAAGLLVVAGIGIAISSRSTSPTSPFVRDGGAFVGKLDLSDWKIGTQQVTDGENRLFSQPQPEKVGEVMTQECSCYQDTVKRLQALQAKGQRVAGPNIILNSVGIDSAPKPNQIRVTVVLSSANQPVVDSSGKVIEPSPEVRNGRVSYLLEKGTDNKWRIADRKAAVG